MSLGSRSGPASCLLGVGRARTRRACVSASDPSRTQRIFGPLPACPCSVCVLAQSAAFRSVLVLRNNNNNKRTKWFPARGHTVTNTLTPGCCEGKTPHRTAPHRRRRASRNPNSGRRFREDACALSSRSWPHEPLSLVLPRPRRRHSSRACVCPGDGGAEATDGDGGHQRCREQFVDKRHFSVAERKARFRHLQPHCLPEPPAASTRDTCPILRRRAEKK